MSIPRSMIFADGENLVARYENMVKNGARPKESVVYEPGSYVWHERISKFLLLDIVRVSYYTSIVGDTDKVLKIKKCISKIIYSFHDGAHAGRAQIVPCVFKKESKNQKTRNVDINIIIDVMRASYLSDITNIFLLSGDGDYLPLIEEVMRHGKIVTVAAFSSGLNSSIPNVVDEFRCLDDFFFL